jgi:hypothetical protein
MRLLTDVERNRLVRGAELASEDMDEAETPAQRKRAARQYRECMGQLEADNRRREASDHA